MHEKSLESAIMKDTVEFINNNNNNLVLGRLTIDFNIDYFKTLKFTVDKHDKANIKQDGMELFFSTHSLMVI